MCVNVANDTNECSMLHETRGFEAQVITTGPFSQSVYIMCVCVCSGVCVVCWAGEAGERWMLIGRFFHVLGTCWFIFPFFFSHPFYVFMCVVVVLISTRLQYGVQSSTIRKYKMSARMPDVVLLHVDVRRYRVPKKFRQTVWNCSSPCAQARHKQNRTGAEGRDHLWQRSST